MLLRPYQNAAVDAVFAEWAKVRSTLLVLPTGLGKAQPVDEPVLTPTGWAPIGSLHVGSLVVSSSGGLARVTGVFPQGPLRTMRLEASDGAWTRCSEDHLWAVSTKWERNEKRPWRVRTCKELASDLRDGSGAHKWFLPLVKPTIGINCALRIHPYIVGALIGDGGLRHNLMLSSADSHIINRVAALMPEITLRRLGKYDYALRPGITGCRGSELHQFLTELGLRRAYSHEKRIPERHLFASVASRIELLRGLMDTDGTVTPEGHASFSTTSRGLADDVVALVRSLGGATRVRDRATPTYTHKGERRFGRPAFNVTVTLNGINPFSLPRKARLVNLQKRVQTRAITAIEPGPIEECVCISVDQPDHLYVTRDYLLTHNTICFAEIAARTEKRVLILAHSEELIWQARQKVKQVTGLEPDIEMATYKADSSMWRKRIIVGTIQTQRARMTRFDPGEFGAVIIDEAHHAPAESYRRVLEHYGKNPDCRFLGVTATPDRTDGFALGGVFDSVAYQLPLHDAIEQGWLVPIRQQPIQIHGLDWSAVRVTAGDMNASDMGEAMLVEKVPQEIADTVYRELQGRKAIVFVPTVAVAALVADILNRHQAGCAAVVSGAMPKDERKAVLAAFAERRLQIVVNCMVLTEGFDDPGVEVVVLARPTKSRALFAQMIGRGTRALPGIVDGPPSAPERRWAIAASAKPSVEIIDLRGNVGRHKLVTAVDILAGKPLPDLDQQAVNDRANAILEREGRGISVEDAIEQAARELAAERARAEEARVRREAEREAEREKRRHLKATARYEKGHLVDPFDVFDVDGTPERTESISKPLSEKQRAVLEKQGVNVDAISAANARRLLSEIVRRFNSGECSYKQAKVLAAHGYDTKVSRKEASEIIDRIFGKRASTNHQPASPQVPITSVRLDLASMERF